MIEGRPSAPFDRGWPVPIGPMCPMAPARRCVVASDSMSQTGSPELHPASQSVGVLIANVAPDRAARILGNLIEAGFEASAAALHQLPTWAGRAPAAVLLELSGDDEEAVAQARSVGKAAGRAPVIVLSGARCLSIVEGLRRYLRVAEFMGLSAEPGYIVRRTAAVISREAEGLGRLIGTHDTMQNLRRRLGKVARSPSTALLLGESGTGKGEAARELHRLSGRSGNFVHVDCASLAASVIESELFGHERGAFTGAHSSRRGRFEEASAGTVFLDEIGELPLEVQAKLLRVLNDLQFERVGGNATIAMNARIVAATNRDLAAEAEKGAFRFDLFYRLNVISMTMPPLRERLSDLPGLVDALVARISERLDCSPPRVDAEFVETLAGHDWPGNVRELQNLLERILVEESPTVLDRAYLEGWAEAPSSSEVLPIERALAECGWHQGEAADRLGLTIDQLRYRMRKLGIRRPQAGS